MNLFRTIIVLLLGFYILLIPPEIYAGLFDSFKSSKKSVVSDRYLLGSVSDVTVNNVEFENYDNGEIVFYPGDLEKDGKVAISGFLDSDSKVPVEKLAVEITVDGGDTWTRAKGQDEWDWSFEPELGIIYHFALRVVEVKTDSTIELISPQGSLGVASLNDDLSFSWSYPDLATYRLIYTDMYGLNKKVYKSSLKQINKNLIDMIKVNGNSMKWYIEAYNSDESTLLATSEERTLYFPDLSSEATLNYFKNGIVYSQSVSEDTINISNATTAILNGTVKNSTANSMVVDVLLDNETANSSNNLFSQQFIVPANGNMPFTFELLSSLEDEITPLKLSVKKNIQTTSNSTQIQNSFVVTKSNKNSYSIGDFSLITDAKPVNGKISGSGTIEAGILSEFDNCDGTLTINFANLSVSNDDITDTINYTAPAVMTLDKTKVNMTINKIVFSPSEAYIDASVTVKKIGKFVAPVSVDVPHVTLKADSFNLETDINWRGESGDGSQEIPLWWGGYQLSLMLKEMHLSIDTTRGWYEIVKLSNIEGGIKFGDIFSGTNTSIELATDGSFIWSLDGETAINTNKSINFKSCSGKIDLINDVPSVTIGGTIRTYLTAGNNTDREHIDLKIGDNLTIDSGGIKGTVTFDATEATQTTTIASLPVSLKTLSIEFDGGISGGSLGLGVKYDDFFKSGKELGFDVLADVSDEGLTNFRIDNGTASVEIAGFATLSLTNIAYKNNGNEPSYFSTDMSVTVSNSSIIGNTSFEFNALKFDETGVDLNGASVWQALHQDGSVTATLYGIEVSLNKVGFGILNEKLFIGFEGGGSIGGDIVSVDDIKVALYKDGNMDLLENPNVYVDSSTVSFTGTLIEEDNEEIKGFKATGDLVVKNLGSGIHVNGEFMCGEFQGTDNYYWRVAGYASTGTPISLGAIPLNLYGFGGGVGYNVSYDTVTDATGSTKQEWVPKNNSGSSISITTVFGTTDGGYTLHGPATLSFSTGGQITFNSTMYITSGLMQTPADRKVDIFAQLTTSPFRFYASGDALVTQKASENFNIMEVNGHVDILFASSNSHMYIGTKETPITADFLEVAENTGYLMFDDKGMAFGYEMSLKKRGSCCLFYGSIDVGTRVDTMIGIQPFYIDAEGKIWAIVSAGVEYKSFSYEVFNAGATIAARFRAPNPTYGKFDVELYYSILGGLKSGRYEMTYWINKPTGGEDATTVNVGNFEVFKYALPMNGETQVSRYPKIEIATKLPLDNIMLLDSLLDEPTGTQYKFYMPKIREWSQNDPNMPMATNAEESILLFDLNSSSPDAIIENIFIGGKVGTGGTKLVFNTNRPLLAGHTYKTLFAGVIKDMGTGEIVGGQGYQQTFTVTKDSAIGFRSLVEEVHPHMGAQGVYKQSDLYMRVRGVTSAKIKVKLYDPLNREFGDMWQFKQNTLDNSQSSQLYAYINETHDDLKPVIVYICDQTGEQKEALIGNDKEYNPFLWSEVPNQNSSETQESEAVVAEASYSNNYSTTTASTVNTYTATDTYKPNLHASESDESTSNNRKRKQSTTENTTKNRKYGQSATVGTAKGRTKNPKRKQSSVTDISKDVSSYTYTRKVLTTYTIKAQETENEITKDLYSSTFDVAVPQYTVTTDKAGNQISSYPDYANEVEMLHETMKDAKFRIVRAPIDYDKKQEEWDFYIHSSYEPSIDECHNYNAEAYMASIGATSNDYEDAVQACEAPVKQRLDHYSDVLDKKYARGGLSYLLFEFAYHGFIDPQNVALNITPTCRAVGVDGSSYNINPQGKSFSNVDALGNQSGENGYQILSAIHNKMQVKLNLNLYPDVRDTLSRFVSQRADFNNIQCGSFSLNPRVLSVSGFDSTVQEEDRTTEGLVGIYKNGIPLTE